MEFWGCVALLVVGILLRLLTGFEYKRAQARVWNDLSLYADCVIAGSAIWLFFYCIF